MLAGNSKPILQFNQSVENAAVVFVKEAIDNLKRIIYGGTSLDKQAKGRTDFGMNTAR